MSNSYHWENNKKIYEKVNYMNYRKFNTEVAISER